MGEPVRFQDLVALESFGTALVWANKRPFIRVGDQVPCQIFLFGEACSAVLETADKGFCSCMGLQVFCQIVVVCKPFFAALIRAEKGFFFLPAPAHFQPDFW